MSKLHHFELSSGRGVKVVPIDTSYKVLKILNTYDTPLLHKHLLVDIALNGVMFIESQKGKWHYVDMPKTREQWEEEVTEGVHLFFQLKLHEVLEIGIEVWKISVWLHSLTDKTITDEYLMEEF